MNPVQSMAQFFVNTLGLQSSEMGIALSVLISIFLLFVFLLGSSFAIVSLLQKFLKSKLF
jgi:hypothetical protein